MVEKVERDRSCCFSSKDYQRERALPPQITPKIETPVYEQRQEGVEKYPDQDLVMVQ